ncbi:hypothetical protein KY366_07220 [Candidatus Woesearchaeota archaeon]|nr:hypothetical protein [Candidatus Woesearchaeota archaeon]
MASRAYNLEEFVKIVNSWGLQDVMLPFLLIFVIFFALLAKTKVLGEDKKKFNLIIAMVIALLVVIPHVMNRYPSNFDPVDIMNQALPGISIVIVAAIGSLLIIGAFGGQVSTKPAYLTGGVIVIAGVIYAIFVYPNLSPLLLAIALIFVITVAFSNPKREGTNYVQAGISIGAFCVVLYFFGAARGWFREIPQWLENPMYQGVIITIIIVGTLMGYVTSSEKG